MPVRGIGGLCVGDVGVVSIGLRDLGFSVPYKDILAHVGFSGFLDPKPSTLNPKPRM